MEFMVHIKTLFTPGATLSQRVARGSFWVFALRIANRLLGFVKIIILARILPPADFGLLGIAMLTISTLDVFSNTGLQSALIQKKEDIRSYLDVTWTVLILRGFILFVILYVVAPYVAVFFKVPHAVSLIRVVGISLLFQGVTNIGVIYFSKEMEFHKEFLYQIAGTTADFLVSLFSVLIFKNVWALVFGFLAANFTRCAVSYFVQTYRPRVRLNLTKLKELLGFSKWIVGSGILTFLLTQGDDAFVGKYLGAAMLGFYQMAYLISNLPATEITNVISQVTFPAYSKLQTSIPQLREAYLKILQMVSCLSLPIAGMIAFLAPDITGIFFGEKWMPIVPWVRILSLYGLFRSFGALPGSAIKALGKVAVLPLIPIIQLIFIVILIYPMAKAFQLTGVSIVVTLSVVLAVLYALKIGNAYLSINFRDWYRIVAPPFAAAMAMCTALGGLNYLTELNLASFIIKVIGGIFIYLLVYSLLTKQNIFRFFKNACRQVIGC